MRKSCWVAAAVVVFSSVAAVSADTVAIPNRLEKARKGEWVVYSAMGGITEKQTIVEIEELDGDRQFTISSELSIGDEIVQAEEVAYSLSQADRENVELVQGENTVSVTTKRETVRGREIDVVVVETIEDGDTFLTVISDAIPVSGLVRIEANGVSVIEVEDFGE